MKKNLLNITTLLIAFFNLCFFASTAQVSISNVDLQPIIGSWQGSLTYLDYTTNKPFTMPANIDIEQIGQSNTFVFGNSFPEEPNANWTDTMVLSKNGTMINDEIVKSKRLLESGNIEIVTEILGIDGNDKKPALLKYTYTIGKDRYVHRKDVQWVGETEWIERHEYKYDMRAKILSPQQMKNDLALVKATWENIHPGLYRYNTKTQIENYFKALDAQINQPMEQRNFFVLLSQLNEKLKCGHSFVSFYNNKRILKANLFSRVFIPILFQVIDGKFIVTHNLSDNKDIALGNEIITINNIPIKTIIDSLLTVSKADGLKGLNKKRDNITIHPRNIYTDNYSLFDVYFPLFFKKNLNDPTFSMAVLKDKKVIKATIAGLSKEDREQRFIAQYGEVPKNEKSWYIKKIDKKTAVLRLGDFSTFNWKFDVNKYLDSVFTMLNTEGYQNLIVDIRQNEGGADETRDAVLTYLTPKSLGCANAYRRLYRYTSIPDSLKPYLDTWDDSFKQNKIGYELTAEGFYQKPLISSKCAEILPKPNHFKGKIYLITDASNSSATFIMADVFKKNNLGTIVGEKTGGSQQGINGGELFFFYLPNSKIEMDIPLIYQAPQTSRPDEGILPDYEIKTTVSDVATMNDPQLDFILRKLIKNKSGK